MNDTNGSSGRNFPQENGPVRKFTDNELIDAANRAVRRAKAEKDGRSVPSAPRRRRNTPVDFAERYNLPPQKQVPFDPVESEEHIMGEADYEALEASKNRKQPADTNAFISDELPQHYDPEERELSDDGYPDTSDIFDDIPDNDAVEPSADIPAARSGSSAEPSSAGLFEPEFSEEPPGDLIFAFHRSENDRSENIPGEKDGVEDHIYPRPEKRKSKAGKTDGRVRMIITAILILIAAAVLSIGIWLFNNFSLVGGSLIDINTKTLDLSGKDIHTVLGISRLEKLRYLDLSGNNISIRQFNKLSKNLPGCEIIWDVPVKSGVTVNNTVSDADLSSISGIKISGLKKSIPYMTALRRMDLTGCGLKDEQLYELERSCVNIDLVWDVEMLGERCSTDTGIIAPGKVSAAELEEAAEKIKYFDKLDYLDLSQCGLSEKELHDFAVRHPEARAAWLADIGGQSFYTNVAELRLTASAEAPISDISALSSFYKLQSLTISGGDISDLSPISGIKTLRILSLTHCEIADISAISGLTGLVYLELNNNRITELSPLSDMQNLEELHLNSNNIADISPLAGLQKLRVLNVQGNNITSVSRFGNVPSLESLSLRKNHLAQPEEVRALYDITSLRILDLQQNDFFNSAEATIIDELADANPDCTLYIWK